MSEDTTPNEQKKASAKKDTSTQETPEFTAIEPDTDVTREIHIDSAQDEITEVSSGHENSAEEFKKLQSDYLYLRAEFENYKKHVLKDRSEYLKYGSERLLVDMLNVLDNFDRALQADLDASNASSVEAFKKGMELTASEFRTTLKRFGVEEIACEGQAFDPTLHEALSSEETDRVEPGFVSRVFKSAYKLHDRLIRPAQVVVAKAKSNQN